MAKNCWVEPTIKSYGAFGSGVRDVGELVVGDATVNVIAALVIPDMLAVILVVPSANPVTIPDNCEMVATLMSELFHVTLELMFAVELSE